MMTRKVLCLLEFLFSCTDVIRLYSLLEVARVHLSLAPYESASCSFWNGLGVHFTCYIVTNARFRANTTNRNPVGNSLLCTECSPITIWSGSIDPCKKQRASPERFVQTSNRRVNFLCFFSREKSKFLWTNWQFGVAFVFWICCPNSKVNRVD